MKTVINLVLAACVVGLVYIFSSLRCRFGLHLLWQCNGSNKF